MLKVSVEVDEEKLRELVRDFLNEQLGELGARAQDIVIETRSKNNYRKEWEAAEFRARFLVNK